MMTRLERYRALVERLGPFDIPSAVIEPMPRRFLLIERWRGWETGDAWLSTHDSIQEAAAHPDVAETGYIPELLVDLDTGEEWQPFAPSILRRASIREEGIMKARKRKRAKKPPKVKPPEYTGLFVYNPDDDTYTCEDCFSPELRKRLGDDDVEVWEEGSHGWTGQPMCASCKLSIPVYVDSEDAKAPETEDRVGVVTAYHKNAREPYVVGVFARPYLYEVAMRGYLDDLRRIGSVKGPVDRFTVSEASFNQHGICPEIGSWKVRDGKLVEEVRS